MSMPLSRSDLLYNLRQHLDLVRARLGRRNRHQELPDDAWLLASFPFAAINGTVCRAGPMGRKAKSPAPAGVPDHRLWECPAAARDGCRERWRALP